ncbi:hypothetical protein DFH11DRAFT_282139 [Phellopilus nigrolimitatus]|nr:hypothetical protein DFH11DRAFT_282139 [Phellopilus nigrolimitatus]
MTLFGNKHNNTADATYGGSDLPSGTSANGTGGGNRLQKGGQRHNADADASYGGSNVLADGRTAGTGTGNRLQKGGQRHHDDALSSTHATYGGSDVSSNPENATGAGNRLHHGGQQNHPNAAGTADETGYGQGAQTGAGHNVAGYNSNVGGTGYDSTDGNGPGAAQSAMPPRTDRAGNPIHPGTTGRGTSGGGGTQRFAGKVEHAVGSAIGSQNLKAKGLAKEQESTALKAQAAELSEAERLESSALARRERAVAHGAHPQYRHLGGRDPETGTTNPDELGGGGNYGASGVGGAGSGARGGY